MTTESCPCGSLNAYPTCCGLYISGQQIPPDAEAVMRSRYTAYQQRNNAWLIATWHPSQRTPELTAALDADTQQTEWLSLNVISHDVQKETNEAFVTFFARYKDNQQPSAIYERSRFLLEDQHWYYIDGVHLHAGRNDPCPCGSAKKYKKCCGF